MDRPALFDVQGRGFHVQWLAEHVEHVPLDHIAHRHRDRAPGVDDRGPPGQAVGGCHGDGPDRVVAQVLFHLERQGPGFPREGHVDLERVVDIGYVLLGGELHIDDRADDPRDTAGTLGGLLPAGGGVVLDGCGHDTHSFPATDSAIASAPPTISLISWVISAWRALLASRVKSSSRSLALSVADFMARRRDAISAAAASSSAW